MVFLIFNGSKYHSCQDVEGVYRDSRFTKKISRSEIPQGYQNIITLREDILKRGKSPLNAQGRAQKRTSQIDMLRCDVMKFLEMSDGSKVSQVQCDLLFKQIKSEGNWPRKAEFSHIVRYLLSKGLKYVMISQLIRLTPSEFEILKRHKKFKNIATLSKGRHAKKNIDVTWAARSINEVAVRKLIHELKCGKYTRKN